MLQGTRHTGVVAQKTIASESSAELAAASYTVPARFNKHRIRADLGPFGRIRLRFHKRPVFLLPPARLRGEDGYTSAHAHRIHGQLHRDGPVRCSGSTRAIELKAKSGSTRFLALQDHDFGLTSLSASTRERSGRVEIVRKAGRLIRADAGSADYASPGSWSGSLAVSFPGEDDVPLTGTGLSATLRSAKLPAGGALSTP